MSRSTSLPIYISALLLLVFAPQSSNAQGTLSSNLRPDNAMQEMMRLMMPGEGHKVFAGMSGKWIGTLRMWNPAAPAAPPAESATESDNKLVLGGRFVLEEASGSVMGMPMQRMSVLGYDNFTKRYTLVYYSSLETVTYIATGTLDADGKAITLRGEYEGPQGKHTFKNVIRFQNDDMRIFESYQVRPDGSEIKAFEQISKRAK